MGATVRKPIFHFGGNCRSDGNGIANVRGVCSDPSQRCVSIYTLARDDCGELSVRDFHRGAIDAVHIRDVSWIADLGGIATWTHRGCAADDGRVGHGGAADDPDAPRANQWPEDNVTEAMRL